MTSRVMIRSAGGCLTCKKRRKKCDEAKPVCHRCTAGGFLCLGYAGQPAVTSFKDNHTSVESTEVISSSAFPSVSSSSSNHSVRSYSISNHERNSAERQCEGALALQFTNQQIACVPQPIPLDPMAVVDIIPFIIQHLRRRAKQIFRPFPIEDGIALRVNDSEIARWTTFIGAKIFEALTEGHYRGHYMGWIDRLHRIIVGSPASQELGISDVRTRLSGLRELSTYAYMISSNASGYALFKESTPYFLQVASTFSNLWAPNSAIYLSHALCCPQYGVRAFVLMDTVTALAFGVSALLVYETTPQVTEMIQGTRVLEWVYGCPPDIILLMARINAWRASKWIESSLLETGESTKPDDGKWRTIETLLRCWRPTIEEVDGSSNLVTRLAIQESWRQGVLIYLYMGMCGASSEDARVHACVKQVVQLARTVEQGSLMEPHLFIPCLLAAAAARHESHRALLRAKLRASRNEHIWILRGIDFIPVLDHLWHGAGAGGAPVKWDDYVLARVTILPIDT
ncbi:hypothetical protein BDV93DRAFT_528998 [Ceratobasidium sp. AG-I]|nr:hypothetical protein BDV93DRAFT_528998 [Ceratobasidium sp. AG-I]